MVRNNNGLINSIDIINTLSRTKLFADIPLSNISALVNCGFGHVRFYKKNEMLIHCSEKVDSFSVILQGQVIIKHNLQDGSETVENVLKEKKTIGIEFADTNANNINMFDYIAQTDVIVYCIKQEYIKNGMLPGGMETTNIMLRNMLGLLVCENQRQNRKLYILSMGSIRNRLIAFLNYERERSGSDEFYIAFSRENLASYLYVNRSALSREIGQMVRDGLLISKGRYFKLLDESIILKHVM